MARSWGDSRIVNQHEGFAAAISQQLQSQGSHVRVSAAPGVCSRQDAAARGCTTIASAAAAVGGGRQFAQVQQQQQRRHAESSNHVLMGRSREMDISLPLYWESMVRSCRSSLDALEFEFNEKLPEKNDDCIFSPATTSHYDSSSHVCQPRYFSKFLCMKSPLHSAPALETVALQDSRSSSFRSQSSSIAWETSGDMKISEAGDNSSSSSSSPEQDSTPWSVRRDSRSSNGCKQEEPVHRRASTEEEPNSYSKSSNAEISWTSTLSTTLLRSWKALFGTKKKNQKSSSSKRRSREHTEEHTEETTTCSAPMQKITAAVPLSAACKSSERLRGKKTHASTIPYVGEEAPQLFAATATPGASGTAAEKERTLRLLMRESSLHSHIHNSPGAVLLPAKGSSSNTSEAQKQQPNLIQSLSAMPATTFESPGGGRRRRRLQLQEEEEEEEEDCATPKLQSSSRERWKKYVKKILMSPHTDPQQQQQQLQLQQQQQQQQQQNKIDNRIRVTTTTVASSLGAATPVATPAANTPLGTPSRKALPKVQGSSSSSESSTKPTLPTLKLQGSSSSSEFSSAKPALPTLKLLQGSSSESSSTTKLAAATSKIARIVASTVMTPRSKAKFNPRNPSCSNGGVVVASPAAINHNNNTTTTSMTLSEQHNAVQGAIAHCKQSHSREEEHSNFLHSKTRVVNKT
ncbi:hypothetical protein CY35_11G116000 [Sphagnum magellanicum]|nr:hypothetical protein CY35_11G116000 [Sphagnum magellanicum]